jgi:SAM-dependent methyltransferase
MNKDYYDRDYYEAGIESGKSCYQNFRWVPELTIPMAMTMIDLLGIKRDQSVLDFGCAKGYLVRALRMLYRDAWGVDISDYALKHVDPEVKMYCHPVSALRREFDFCIAKDVFEHIPVDELKGVLESINAKILFAIIPLGGKGKYFAEANNFDKSHVTCQSDDWWEDCLNKAGWRSISYHYSVPGIKDHYSHIPNAHGFFINRRIKC